MQPPRHMPAVRRVAVFDFEHTLFSLSKFLHQQLFFAFEQFGVSSRHFAHSFFSSAPRHHESVAPKKLCEHVAAETGLKTLLLEVALAECIFSPNTQTFITPHLATIIAHARMKFDQIILLCNNSDVFRQVWLRHLGIHTYFRPEEILIARNRHRTLATHLGAPTQVTLINSHRADAKRIGIFLSRRNHAVVQLVKKFEHLNQITDLF